MVDVTLNGEPVLGLSLHLPVRGVWTADLSVASDVDLAPNQGVELRLDDVVYVGTVILAGIDAQRLNVSLAGGDIDWREVLPTKHYREATADLIASDLGLRLDSTIGKTLGFWTRAAGTVGAATESLALHLGLPWRANPDGSVQMRAPDPSEQISEESGQILSRDDSRGLVLIAAETSDFAPGKEFLGDSLGDVTYTVTSKGARCRYYTDSQSRVRAAFERLVRWVTRDHFYLGQFTSTVASQNVDGTLDLVPDDERLRGSGLQGVPIRHGLPGVTVKVSTGAKVLIGFDAGDPSKPYASLWHEGSVTAVNIGGSDAVAIAKLVDMRLTQMQTAIDNHIHPPIPLGGGPVLLPTPPIVWPQNQTMDSKVLYTK